MTSFNAKQYFRQEAKAERLAAIEVGGTSFADILRFNKLELEWLSSEKKKEVKVRGQDIKNNDLWRKFLLSKGYNDADLISLVDDVGRLAEEFDIFLDTSCSERYRNLDAAGKIWCRKVVRLVVRYHIMENKLDGYLRGQEDAFYDERVAYFYTLIRQIRTAMEGAARVIQHIVKDKEERQQFLNDFFSAHYEQFRTIPFPQRDDILRLVEPDEEAI